MGSLIGGLLPGGKSGSPGAGTVGKTYLGLLDQYKQGASSLFDSTASLAPKYSDLMAGEFNRLGAGAMNTVRGSAPNTYALLDKLTSTANGMDLNYGASLPPELLRYTNQLTRSGQAARGMGYGPADAYQETSDAARLSADLTDRNRSFASNVANLGYGMQTSPYLTLLSGEVGAGQNALLTPAQSVPLMQMVYGAENQNNMRNADIQFEKNKMIGDGAGSIIGMLAGAFM